MRYYYFLLVSFVASILLLSCAYSQVRSGDTYDSFHTIKVATGLTVYLSQGATEHIEVEGSDRDVAYLVIETKNGVLNMYLKPSGWFYTRDRDIKVYVRAVSLEKIELSSGASLKGESAFKSENLTLITSSGSEMKLEINCESATAKASSGSEMYLTGKSKEFVATSSSGSEIKADDLRVKYADVKASSGSEISLYVLDELIAKASSGASITAFGTPKARETNASSGGSIRIR